MRTTVTLDEDVAARLRESVDLDHALALAGQLEDEELIRRLARGT